MRKTLPKICERFTNTVGGGQFSTGCCKKSACDTWIATAARRARPYRTSLICSYGATFLTRSDRSFHPPLITKSRGMD